MSILLLPPCAPAISRQGVSLFDLSADVAEQHDVAASHPDVVERLKGFADRFREAARSDR
jgi:hypothetical protein